MTPDQVALKYGYRSGLEDKLGASLTARGVPFEFEAHKLKFTQPEKQRTYLPDFRIPHATIPGKFLFIEGKGRWLTEDRQKHIAIRASHPEIDLRFVFSNAQARLSKQSATTYAAYCERQGWLWANRDIPLSWLQEYGYCIK